MHERGLGHVHLAPMSSLIPFAISGKMQWQNGRFKICSGYLYMNANMNAHASIHTSEVIYSYF